MTGVITSDALIFNIQRFVKLVNNLGTVFLYLRLNGNAAKKIAGKVRVNFVKSGLEYKRIRSSFLQGERDVPRRHKYKRVSYSGRYRIHGYVKFR
jgi:hypothetical protein